MVMESKILASLALLISGGILAVYGFISGDVRLMDLGIAGAFLSAVVFTFKSSSYVKREALDAVASSYEGLIEGLAENLYLEGNPLYIPPYENLPRGGLFIPLHRDFDLDLARLDDGTVFLTDVPSEKEMGLFLGPFGWDLIEKFEEHFEGSLEGAGAGAVESVAGSVLRALNLAKRVYIEELDDRYRVIVDPELTVSPESPRWIPGPVCSSVLLALARGTGNLLEVVDFKKDRYGIEFKVKKLGSVEEWM